MRSRAANIQRVDDEWDLWSEDDVEADEPVESPWWRRWVIGLVALVVALSLAGLQLQAVIGRGAPPVADNGLEVCGFDYCVVQDAIRERGLGLEMARLASVYLDEAQATILADDLARGLRVPPVEVQVADRLDGRTAGQYSPSTRTIYLEPPIRAWIVYHEVAHTIAGGHDGDFVDALVRLVGLGVELP